MTFDPSRRSFPSPVVALSAVDHLPAAPPTPYAVLGKTGLKITRFVFGSMITSDPAVIERALDPLHRGHRHDVAAEVGEGDRGVRARQPRDEPPGAPDAEAHAAARKVHDAGIRAMSEPFGDADRQLLAETLRQIGPHYCRLCGRCRECSICTVRCAHGLNVAATVRHVHELLA